MAFKKVSLGENSANNAALAMNMDQKGFDSSTAQDTTNFYHIIQIVNDTVFAALTQVENMATEAEVDKVAGVYSGITIPAGTWLFGYFTDIDLTSGVIQAFSHRLTN